MASRRWRKKVSTEIEAIEQELTAWFSGFNHSYRSFAISYFVQLIEELMGRQPEKDFKPILGRCDPNIVKDINTKKGEIYQRAMTIASQVPGLGQDEISRSQFSERVILSNIAAWCRIQLIEERIDQMDHHKKSSKAVKVVKAVGGVTLATLIIRNIVKRLKDQKD